MKNLLQHIWTRGLADGSLAAYAFAFVCVELACAIRIGLNAIDPEMTIPYITFFPAVLMATLIGGRRAGLFSVVLSVISAWWAFLPPYFSFSLTPIAGVSLLIFILSSSIIFWGAAHYRTMLHKLREERSHRDAVVSELGHRLKNKLATVYAILSRELRSQPEIWEKISGRLKALSATDDFIARTDGQGASMRDILQSELSPYDVSRLKIPEADIFLPPNLATTFALIFHELATNAAKYGAFSTHEGEVTLWWNEAGGRVQIHWKENGGPKVQKPERNGFGMLLIERALASYGGKAEILFDPDGFACRLVFTLEDAEIPGLLKNAPMH